MNPEAVVDLRTSTGTSEVQGRWLYSDASLADVPFNDAGPDRRPTGPANTTHEIRPASLAPDTDERSWQAISPETLETRRGAGKVSFSWYRLHFTVPARVGRVDPTGDDVVFEIVVDDYSDGGR